MSPGDLGSQNAWCLYFSIKPKTINFASTSATLLIHLEDFTPERRLHLTSSERHLQRNYLADVMCHLEGVLSLGRDWPDGFDRLTRPPVMWPPPAPAIRCALEEKFIHVREHEYSVSVFDAVKDKTKDMFHHQNNVLKMFLCVSWIWCKEMTQFRDGAQCKNRGGRAVTSVLKEEALSIFYW